MKRINVLMRGLIDIKDTQYQHFIKFRFWFCVHETVEICNELDAVLIRLAIGILTYVSDYTDSMAKQRTLTFSNANIETTTNYKGVPSEDMFKDELTKLTIVVIVKSGDASVQREIFRNRRHFKDIIFRGRLSFTTTNHITTRYYVGNSGYLPPIFDPAFALLFAIIGFSLPLRWFVYFKVGHVTFRVNKMVFEPEACTPPPSPVDADQSAFQPETCPSSFYAPLTNPNVVSAFDPDQQ